MSGKDTRQVMGTHNKNIAASIDTDTTHTHFHLDKTV